MFSQIFINNFLYKTVLAVFFCLLAVMFIPTAVSAQGVTDVSSNMNRFTNAFAGEQGAGLSTSSDPRTIVARVVEIFLSILGILFLAYAVYAGYLIMSSGGAEDKIKKGKSTLQTAAIGILVILSAYSILYFVLRSVWFSSGPSGSYIEAGVGTRAYDYCGQGRGDAISCPPR